MAYSKQTWDTNTNFTPSRMNHIEDGIFNAQAQAETIPTASQIPYGSSNVGSALDTVNNSLTVKGGNIQNAITYHKQGSVVTLIANASIQLGTSGIQLPAEVKPRVGVLFTGKAFVSGKGDIWSQPFRIDNNGVLTARSDDNNSSIAVTWWAFTVTYITN